MPQLPYSPMSVGAETSYKTPGGYEAALRATGAVEALRETTLDWQATQEELAEEKMEIEREGMAQQMEMLRMNIAAQAEYQRDYLNFLNRQLESQMAMKEMEVASRETTARISTRAPSVDASTHYWRTQAAKKAERASDPMAGMSYWEKERYQRGEREGEISWEQLQDLATRMGSGALGTKPKELDFLRTVGG